MDKKGAGWKSIVVIVIILVSFAIILGWLIFYTGGIGEAAQASKDKLVEAFKS